MRAGLRAIEIESGMVCSIGSAKGATLQKPSPRCKRTAERTPE